MDTSLSIVDNTGTKDIHPFKNTVDPSSSKTVGNEALSSSTLGTSSNATPSTTGTAKIGGLSAVNKDHGGTVEGNPHSNQQTCSPRRTVTANNGTNNVSRQAQQNSLDSKNLRIGGRSSVPLFQAEYNYAKNNSSYASVDGDTPPSPPPIGEVHPSSKGYTNNLQPRRTQASSTNPPTSRITVGSSVSTPIVMSPTNNFSTPITFFVIECVLIILFGLFVGYDDEAKAIPSQSTMSSLLTRKPSKISNDQENGGAEQESTNILEIHTNDDSRLHKYYPFFQDVHVMIFVGFGFLMTFLKKYGYSAVGYNMLIAAIAIQWSILCRGVFHFGFNTITINIQSLINGDFAAGSVLISFGALLGVTSPLHLVTLTMIEVFLYALNEWIGAEVFGAMDIGGSMWIHTFGAYFGLALSLTLKRQKDIDTSKEGSTYNSDLFAMIGTIFLWLFWPSFNGAMAMGDDQHRAVLNTVLSLTGSCIFSFAASSLMCQENKFDMVHIQNASLAGGVAVGAVADLMIQPFGALVIGASAGLLSTAGYVYLTPKLQEWIGLHDTCGVHNLHGMPGVLSGLISILMAGIASEDLYGKSLYLQYPERAPLHDTQELKMIVDELSSVEGGSGRSAGMQAAFQLAALGTTLGIALGGGLITGFILRIPIFGTVPSDQLFDDGHGWHVPDEEEAYPQIGGAKGNGNNAGISIIHQRSN